MEAEILLTTIQLGSILDWWVVAVSFVNNIHHLKFILVSVSFKNQSLDICHSFHLPRGDIINSANIPLFWLEH